MMTNPIGRLNANSAAFHWMSAANKLLSFKGGSPKSLLAQENRLTCSMLNDSVTYRAGLLMQESQDKIAKDNIKRTFSIFA